MKMRCSKRRRKNEAKWGPRAPKTSPRANTKILMRATPPAPLSSSTPWPPKTLKRFPEPVAPRRDRKALGKQSWNSSYIIPSEAMSCYLMLRHPHEEKGVFHHPPFIQKNMKNLDFCSILASQTPPNPSQIESKKPLGRLLGPLGPSWQQGLKKRVLKVPQETPRRSQTPPKTIPKPSQNPPKIN